MGTWFKRFHQRKPSIPLEIECRLELSSGYYDRDSGLLAGFVKAIDEDKLLLSLSNIYYRGLFLFDPANKSRLIIDQEPDHLIPVKPLSYQSTDSHYTVSVQVLAVSDSEKNNEIRYAEILKWLGSLKEIPMDKTNFSVLAKAET